jgi:hypothetical protein
LQQLRVHFYNALDSTKKNWLPRGNIEDVIRACVNKQCDKSDYITIEFHRYGGIHAVIALYLATKGDNNWVFAQIEALPEEWRRLLIEEVKKIILSTQYCTYMDPALFMKFLYCLSYVLQDFLYFHHRKVRILRDQGK